MILVDNATSIRAEGLEVSQNKIQIYSSGGQ